MQQHLVLSRGSSVYLDVGHAVHAFEKRAQIVQHIVSDLFEVRPGGEDAELQYRLRVRIVGLHRGRRRTDGKIARHCGNRGSDLIRVGVRGSRKLQSRSKSPGQFSRKPRSPHMRIHRFLFVFSREPAVGVVLLRCIGKRKISGGSA